MATSLPFYSQYLDIKNPDWQGKACGVASLAMLLGAKAPSLDELYQLGLDRKAYLPGVGWRHAGLASLAKHFGFKNSYNLDLAKEDMESALAKLKAELKNGPVMVSVFARYEHGHKEGHLVVLLSLNDKEAEVLDPNVLDKKQGLQLIPAAKFIAGWKKRLIVVRL